MTKDQKLISSYKNMLYLKNKLQVIEQIIELY